MADQQFSKDAMLASLEASRPAVTKRILSAMQEAESREARLRSLPWPVRALVSFLRSVL